MKAQQGTQIACTPEGDYCQLSAKCDHEISVTKRGGPPLNNAFGGGFRTPVTMEEPGGSDWEGEAHEPGETCFSCRQQKVKITMLGIWLGICPLLLFVADGWRFLTPPSTQCRKIQENWWRSCAMGDMMHSKKRGDTSSSMSSKSEP